MAMTSNPVLRSLERWVRKGLLTPETAEVLLAEVEEELRGEGHRWTQYALAATGGAILIIAGGTFLAWAWPEMGYAGQTMALAVIGLGVCGLGFRLLPRPRFVPVAYLLLLSGPVLLLLALAYSENAWADKTVGGVLVGVFSLAIPAVLVTFFLKRDSVLGALQAALSFLFFFLFLDRALGLTLEASLWVLDGLAVAGLAWLGFHLRNPKGPEWVLNTFFAVFYASLLLVFFSGEVLWNLEDFVMVPADIWLLIVAAVGAFGLWVNIPRGVRSILLASCVALLVAAWYYGAEKAGALGAVLALTVMAIVLFWASSKLGSGRNGERAEGV